jgi:hypothetical protein
MELITALKNFIVQTSRDISKGFYFTVTAGANVVKA